MSQENLETYQRGVAAINGREFSDELFAEICTPDFRMENTSTAVTDKTYHGAHGVREWINDFFEAFGDETRYQDEEVIAHGDDFVVSVVRLIGRGARSGAPLELRWVAVTWFEGAKMSRGVGYLGRSEALKAVGLAE
jgi:ketosteroid isomerase-like protein